VVEARAITTLSQREENGWRGEERCCSGDGEEWQYRKLLLKSIEF
jgi:hypothetical protein